MSGLRAALGAKVILMTEGREQSRYVLRSQSYLSSNDARVHFGLGAATQIGRLEVIWPNGTTEEFSVPAVDQEIIVRQGEES